MRQDAITAETSWRGAPATVKRLEKIMLKTRQATAKMRHGWRKPMRSSRSDPLEGETEVSNALRQKERLAGGPRHDQETEKVT